MSKVTNNYGAEQIDVLEGLEAVRRRPGMYIGSTNIKGLHHLVWEIVDNSVDEALAGYCTVIKIYINKDESLTVLDDGRGMPVGIHPKLKIPAVRVIHTVLHAGGKFGSGGYKVSGGLHGVGASVVNALSEKMKVEVFRDGLHFVDEYANGGKPVTKLLKDNELPSIGKSKSNGTMTTFLPDKEIFETTNFKEDIICKRLKEIAFLNKGLRLEFTDYRVDNYETKVFYEEEGIVGFIKERHFDEKTIYDEIVSIEEERESENLKENISVEIAFQHIADYNENIFSFCNNITTPEGGTHVSGFKSALTKTINKYAKGLGVLKGKDSFEGRDIRSGLTAVISVKIREPQFEGQTKSKLGNSEVKSLVEEITSFKLELFFDRNQEILKSIIENAENFMKIRRAEAKVRENFNSKNAIMKVMSKLAGCILKNSEDVKTELYIVEGESAGGSAKLARDRNFQAILPLRGKVLNVEKKSIQKILENNEILSIITALGAGFGEGFGDDFDITKLKYDKIIIMTDADVDGSHITTLLLTFFFRYMPEVIYEGKLYLSLPPLYKVSYGKNLKEEKYLQDDEGLNDFLKTIKGKYEIERNKGLGEMNPEELWETTMDPEKRTLIKISIDPENVIDSDRTTKDLMGDKVEPRKKLISEEGANIVINI